ncbi:uncharacterized protein LOC133311632 [Gastrolobium bilobum]|uniref:uncharacterized protein LOC133311632 n=1 Tax=Gastrolobium bilobum TaxID=150636 RepID=UPI002AAF0DFB|nr:uncharacterized protein LOC133311632 [Gastrolobium bilobum]
MAESNQISDPYYLHPNESPSLILVTPSMNGRNYHSCSRAIKVALILKNKLGFVNGTITTPSEDNVKYVAWEGCNMMVLSWVHRSIDNSIIQSIIWIGKANEVWNDLKDRFSQSDMFRISDLQENLYQMNQGNKTVSEYFTSLKTLWDELSNLRPLPTCTCGSSTKIREYREGDQVIRNLRGLNEQFAHVRSQIMLMTPLPTINKAFSLVMQQERQLQLDVHGGNASETKKFASSTENFRGRGSSYRGRGRFNGGRGQISGSKFCTHCKKTNHTIESCYFKHGFPQGYRSKTFQNSSNVIHTVELEHKSSDSRQEQFGAASVNSKSKV